MPSPTCLNLMVKSLLQAVLHVLTNIITADFIRQDIGNKGCIPHIKAMIEAPDVDLEMKEYALKAVVNLALNCMYIQRTNYKSP